MLNFENSPQYQEALANYRQEVYKQLLNPINVIVSQGHSIFDSVYLFYPQDIIEDVFKTIKKEYSDRDERGENDSGLHLGFQEPLLVAFDFMSKKYKAVYLWYDRDETAMPKEFLSKICTVKEFNPN